MSKDLTPYLRYTTSTVVGSLPLVWSNGNIADRLSIQGAKPLRYGRRWFSTRNSSAIRPA